MRVVRLYNLLLKKRNLFENSEVFFLTVNFVSGQEVCLACTAGYRVGDILSWL